MKEMNFKNQEHKFSIDHLQDPDAVQVASEGVMDRFDKYIDAFSTYIKSNHKEEGILTNFFDAQKIALETHPKSKLTIEALKLAMNDLEKYATENKEDSDLFTNPAYLEKVENLRMAYINNLRMEGHSSIF